MRIRLSFLFFLFFFSCVSKKETNNSYNYENDYWTNNLDEIELVMSYVISLDDYKKMLKLDDIEKVKFLDEYWKALDPTPDTSDNELLDELNGRVLESKNLFSGFDGGLFSDRAKIYIIYGAPNNEYKTYLDNYELITWNYKTGYEFNFISDSFGRYKLQN